MFFVILNTCSGKFVKHKRLYKGKNKLVPKLVRDIRMAARWKNWGEAGGFSGRIALQDGTFCSPDSGYQIIRLEK